MAEDLVGVLEADLAIALRAVDRACTAAAFVESHLPPGVHGRRAKESCRRARKVREVLLDFGIKLPPLRKLGEYQIPEPDEPRPPSAVPSSREPGPTAVQSEDLTVAQIAKQTGLHRTTITRRIRRVSRALADRLDEGQRSGKAPRFTPDEVSLILYGKGEAAPGGVVSKVGRGRDHSL